LGWAPRRPSTGSGTGGGANWYFHTMHSKLKEIIEQKKLELKAVRDLRSQYHGRSDAKREFGKALQKENQLAIIAEVKKASPSKGIIQPNFNPVDIATKYEKGGASAVSVLTDVTFFQGSNDYLKRVREAVSLPILRKEFIIDPVQVEETAWLNADAMLLIAAILSNDQMTELYAAAVEFHIEPLIEVHTAKELDRAMRLEPTIIGINNRDLDTFVTDLQTTLSLVKHIPGDVTVVSESGIENKKQAVELKEAGVHAVLVGEMLMKLKDPGEMIRDLSLAASDDDTEKGK
jgi:indole-3-glycerol phosphate synthase